MKSLFNAILILIFFTGEALGQELTDKEILLECFGNYLPETKEAYFDKFKFGVAKEFDSFKDRVLYGKVIGKKAFTFFGKKKCIVAIGSIPRDYECGGCSSLISLVEFEEKDKAWHMSKNISNIANLGYWGKPPKVIFYKISNKTYAIGFECGRMAQGIVFTDLYIFGKIGTNFKEIFNTPTLNDETGNTSEFKNPEDFTSTVSFIDSKDSTFFNLKLDKRISLPKKQRLLEIYTFDGEKYTK